jgi:hypothetical protein
MMMNRNVTHYSYFGAFRSSVSNVGPNAAMLDQNGKLTDIGSWYMGGVATHNIPKGPGGSKTSSATRNMQNIFSYITNFLASPSPAASTPVQSMFAGSYPWSCILFPLLAWGLTG